jgi:hypothetical protein
VNDNPHAAGGTNAAPAATIHHRSTSWGRTSVIVEDSAPPGVVVVGRLARGTAGEARRVVHVFGVEATAVMSDLVRTKCGEALSRTDVEWLTPGVGMPCEPCLGLTTGEPARSPRRELGV